MTSLRLIDESPELTDELPNGADAFTPGVPAIPLTHDRPGEICGAVAHEPHDGRPVSTAARSPLSGRFGGRPDRVRPQNMDERCLCDGVRVVGAHGEVTEAEHVLWKLWFRSEPERGSVSQMWNITAHGAGILPELRTGE